MELFPYQEEGARFLADRHRALLFDAPGLDGINNIVVRDDNQVVHVEAYKYFNSVPGLRIEVSELYTMEDML